jgi:hypothetical protein
MIQPSVSFLRTFSHKILFCYGHPVQGKWSWKLTAAALGAALMFAAVLTLLADFFTLHVTGVVLDFALLLAGSFSLIRIDNNFLIQSCILPV